MPPQAWTALLSFLQLAAAQDIIGQAYSNPSCAGNPPRIQEFASPTCYLGAFKLVCEGRNLKFEYFSHSGCRGDLIRTATFNYAGCIVSPLGSSLTFSSRSCGGSDSLPAPPPRGDSSGNATGTLYDQPGCTGSVTGTDTLTFVAGDTGCTDGFEAVRLECQGDSLLMHEYSGSTKCEGEHTLTFAIEEGTCVLGRKITNINCDGGSGSGWDDPCFGRANSYACRILDPRVQPGAALEQCFKSAKAGAGERAVQAELVLMKELRAADLVLADAEHLTSVVVNQHLREEGKQSELLVLRHGNDTLELTPDHMVWIDGAFAPARLAREGSRLSGGVKVESVTRKRGEIINPITQSGTILAAGPNSEPVLAATGREWIADVLLSGYAHYSLSFSLASFFPQAAQAYHDALLEPGFNTATASLAKLKAALPIWVVVGCIAVADVLLVLGLGAYMLLNAPVTIALLAVAGAMAVRHRNKRAE